jgi:hypothetical protein
VSDCEFTGLGGNGALLSNYNRMVEVGDSLFSDLGDSAVLVVGSDEAVREYRVNRSFHVPLAELTDTEPGSAIFCGLRLRARSRSAGRGFRCRRSW